MSVDRDQVDAWAQRWGVGPTAREQLQSLSQTGAAVPLLTGVTAEVAAELQVLPLKALGQLGDVFPPDLYPAHQRPGMAIGGAPAGRPDDSVDADRVAPERP